MATLGSHRFRRSALAVGGALLLVVQFVGQAGEPAHAADRRSPQGHVLGAASSGLRDHDLGVFIEGLEGLSQQDSDGDPRYYSRGRWLHDGPACFRCTVGPGVAAAALWRRTGDESWLRIAVATMDTAIAQHRRPDGSFGPAGPGEGGVDIQTALFALNLGFTARVLDGSGGLDSTRKEQWARVVAGAADYLDRNGNYRWYTNGNIVLANAAVAGLAWRLTGQARYRSLYDEALRFAMAPDQRRWPGSGLRYTVRPTRPDGSDGAAYFTERGPGGLGYDADYVQNQADIASMMVISIGDPLALRMTNLLVNRSLRDTDRQTWLLDTSGGTRHVQPNRRVPFSTGALAVVVAQGRADLRPLVASQRSSAARSQRASADYTNVGMYMNWASRAAPLILTVDASAGGAVPRLPRRSAPTARR